jgi:hypothetical protein
MNLPKMGAIEPTVARGGDVMPTGDKLRKYVIAFVTALLAIGSGVALTHIGRAPDRTAASVDDETPTIGEGRNLTREVMRSRREHAETPAEARPDPTLGAREPVVTKEAAAKDAAAKEAKEHTAAKDAVKPKPTSVAAVTLPRSRPEGPGDAAAPDPAANAAVATTVAGKIPNAPVVADAQPEQPRSFGSMVFSTVSDLSGKAANLTGDTANFVIDLPGRLISAGGRLFERPQAAPPPKREAL